MLETVGLAGVGKSHLNRRLVHALARRCVDVLDVDVSYRHTGCLARAGRRFAPLLGYLLRSRGLTSAAAPVVAARLFHYTLREEEAARRAPADGVLISQEGWFHKLRRLRDMLGGDVRYADLPPTVRKRLFRAQVVLFLHAEPRVICARKLLRKGQPLTEEALARQYAWSASLGQWEQAEETRRDLSDAARLDGQQYLEIDYRDGYDVERELLPQLSRLGIR